MSWLGWWLSSAHRLRLQQLHGAPTRQPSVSPGTPARTQHIHHHQSVQSIQHPVRENIRFYSNLWPRLCTLYHPSLNWRSVGFFKTASFHWFYFYFSFRTEMLEFLSLCTDPGGCSKPDGGYSKDFQYFNIQIFPITKYTSDGEIWFSIWKIFSSAGLRETCLNSLFMVKFPELV